MLSTFIVEEFRNNKCTVVSLENGHQANGSNPTVSQHYREMFGKTLISSVNVRIIGELGEGNCQLYIIRTCSGTNFLFLGAFCEVHSAVLVSEETGYLIEKQVAVKHLKGKRKLAIYLLAELVS